MTLRRPVAQFSNRLLYSSLYCCLGTKKRKADSLMFDKENLYTVGEFADLWGVTRQTLIYYDKIGLLSPTLTDPYSGYRYYSLEHYNQLAFILHLQKLGLTLPEIIEYKKDLSLETLFHLFNKQKQVIRKMITESISTLESIDDTLQDINLIKEIGVVQEELRSETYLKMTPFSFDNNGKTNQKKTIDLAFYAHLHDCRQLENTFIFSGGTIVNQAITDNLFESVSGFYYKLTPSKSYLANQVLASGRYLIMFYKRAWEDSLDYYQQIKDYAAQHNLGLTGDFYEELIGFHNGVEDYNDYIYKLFIKIK